MPPAWAMYAPMLKATAPNKRAAMASGAEDFGHLIGMTMAAALKMASA